MPGCVRPRESSCPPESRPGTPIHGDPDPMILFLLFALAAPAADPSPAPAPRPLLLVLPVENSGPTAEPCVGEAVADQLPRSLSELGVPAVERAERLQAQATLEIPDVPLTRATSVRVAEALGATRLVSGTYTLDGARLTLSLRLLDVERATLSAPLIASGPVESAMDLIDALAWDVALAGPTPPAGTREQFLARRTAVPFEALKMHARGLAARDPRARVALVRRAVALSRGFDAARVSLGRLLLEQREFSTARVELSRVPAASPLARPARFLQGIAMLELGRYHEAASVYAALAQGARTPGVLNNYALALLRDPMRTTVRASDALRQAVELDPESTDLGFNLAW